MNGITVDRPLPACILHATDPARAHIGSAHTNVAATWEQHKPVQVMDDYDLTELTAHLDLMGEFPK